MKEITKAEMNVVLRLVKSPEADYNANTIAKAVGITAMGALKILKRLESESIFQSRKIGNAVIYRLPAGNAYAHRYAGLLLSREALHANPNIKRWVRELRNIRNADLVVLFGSVLETPNPRDIDVLLVTDQKRFSKLQQEIQELNGMSAKRVHPLYQTNSDIINNIKKRDKPILNAIKGIVVAGEERFLEIYHESRKE